MKLTIIVCGGRSYSNWAVVKSVLCTIQTRMFIASIIHGAATGADSLAARWAEENRIPALACPADWKQFGKAAGPLRNAIMLDKLQGVERPLVVAFPGGHGTADMVNRAKKAGVVVLQVQESAPWDDFEKTVNDFTGSSLRGYADHPRGIVS